MAGLRNAQGDGTVCDGGGIALSEQHPKTLPLQWERGSLAAKDFVSPSTCLFLESARACDHHFYFTTATSQTFCHEAWSCIVSFPNRMQKHVSIAFCHPQAFNPQKTYPKRPPQPLIVMGKMIYREIRLPPLSDLGERLLKEGKAEYVENWGPVNAVIVMLHEWSISDMK